MPVSNGYNPVYLFDKEQNILVLACRISKTHIPESIWTKEINDTQTKIVDFVDKPFRYGDSYIYKPYTPKIEGKEVYLFRDNNRINDEKLLDDLKNLVSIFKECLDIEVKDERSSMSSGLFYMEQ